MKISINVDCDNAPKKKYVVDFAVNIMQQHTDEAKAMLAHDFEWEILGQNQYSGYDALPTIFVELSKDSVTGLEIDNALSHGKLCSMNGKIVTDTSTIAFNDIYEFESHSKQAKIKRIISYRVRVS